MVFAPYQKHSPFGTVVLTMETASRHLEMLPRIKHARLSLGRERERTCQNTHTGVEGMCVRLRGEMSRFTDPLDSIPLTCPLGFDFSGIHAVLLCQNSLHGTIAFPYITPLCTGDTQSILHHINYHRGAGVGFGVVIEHA
jgi:hypothetical protein